MASAVAPFALLAAVVNALAALIGAWRLSRAGQPDAWFWRLGRAGQAAAGLVAVAGVLHVAVVADEPDDVAPAGAARPAVDHLAVRAASVLQARHARSGV